MQEISFYESLGFDLSYNSDDLKNGQAKLDKDPTYKFTYDYDLLFSYSFEMVFTIMLVWMMWFMTAQQIDMFI